MIDHVPTTGMRAIDALSLVMPNGLSETWTVQESPSPAVSSWDGFLSYVRAHRLSAFAHECLRDSPELPENIRSALFEEYQCNVLRGLALTGELLRLLKRWRTVGISAVPFKGPALASLAYGHLGLREYTDLDVLLCPGDIPAAQTVLVELGYIPVLAYPAQAAHLHLRNGYESGFRHPGTGYAVELHWRFAPRFLACELSWENATAGLTHVFLAGQQVSTLGVENHLLALCVHGAKHGWETLSQLLDVHQLIVRNAWDWEATLTRARNLRVERRVRLALSLSFALFGTPLPPELRNAPRSMGKLATQIARRLQQTPHRSPGLWQMVRWNWLCFDSLRDRVNYGVQWVAQPTSEDWIASPDSRWRQQLLRGPRLLRKHAGW